MRAPEPYWWIPFASPLDSYGKSIAWGILIAVVYLAFVLGVAFWPWRRRRE